MTGKTYESTEMITNDRSNDSYPKEFVYIMCRLL